jgi:nitrous oxide reductase accessory protein NosL
MLRTLVLSTAVWLLLAGCAESLNGPSHRNPISEAATCAMCGASVSPTYFEGSAGKPMGPGQAW